jgi:hypothetical protein
MIPLCALMLWVDYPVHICILNSLKYELIFRLILCKKVVFADIRQRESSQDA